MPANVKYIFVWVVWSKNQVASLKSYSMIDDMSLEISFVSKFGSLEEEINYLTGQCVCNIMFTCAKRIKTTCVYDGTKRMDSVSCNIMTTKYSSNGDDEDRQSLTKKSRTLPPFLVIDWSVL